MTEGCAVGSDVSTLPSAGDFGPGRGCTRNDSVRPLGVLTGHYLPVPTLVWCLVTIYLCRPWSGVSAGTLRLATPVHPSRLTRDLVPRVWTRVCPRPLFLPSGSSSLLPLSWSFSGRCAPPQSPVPPDPGRDSRTGHPE